VVVQIPGLIYDAGSIEYIVKDLLYLGLSTNVWALCLQIMNLNDFPSQKKFEKLKKECNLLRK